MFHVDPAFKTHSLIIISAISGVTLQGLGYGDIFIDGIIDGVDHLEIGSNVNVKILDNVGFLH